MHPDEPGHTSRVHLAEWRQWWASRGETELMELLTDRWDPFADETIRDAARPELAKLVRHLHEGATLIETQRSLNEIRRQYQSHRRGQKVDQPRPRRRAPLGGLVRGGDWRASGAVTESCASVPECTLNLRPLSERQSERSQSERLLVGGTGSLQSRKKRDR